MTSTEIPVSMWCWPGPRAAASAQQGPTGQQLLTVFLDPVNLVLTVPPFPSGPLVMAAFLRELARAAGHLAGELEAVSVDRPGAHRASERADGPEAGRW